MFNISLDKCGPDFIPNTSILTW